MARISLTSDLFLYRLICLTRSTLEAKFNGYIRITRLKRSITQRASHSGTHPLIQFPISPGTEATLYPRRAVQRLQLRGLSLCRFPSGSRQSGATAIILWQFFAG